MDISDLKPSSEFVVIGGVVVALYLLYRVEKQQSRQTSMMRDQSRQLGALVSIGEGAAGFVRQQAQQDDPADDGDDTVEDAHDEFEEAKEAIDLSEADDAGDVAAELTGGEAEGNGD
jgi:hypothetical protein